MTATQGPPTERKSAAWWDALWTRPAGWIGRDVTCQRTVEETLRLLQPELRRLEPGQRLRVLDLGCGHGDLSALLLKDARLDVVAVDLSAEALRQFHARDGVGEPALVRASVYELPFPAGAFDVLVSFGYASAASYEGAAPEVARVLSPGGVAIVDFVSPSLYRWIAAPRATWGWYQRYRDPGNGQYHFGQLGLREHFEMAGLRLERLGYLNAYPPLRQLAAQPWCTALDRALSRVAGGLLSRVLLARLRRV